MIETSAGILARKKKAKARSRSAKDRGALIPPRRPQKPKDALLEKDYIAPSDNGTHLRSDPPPTAEAAERPSPQGKVGAQQEVLYFENFAQFGEVLKDTKRSSFSVAQKMLELRAVIHKEEAMAQGITLKVNERAEVMRRLEQQLQKEVDRLNTGGEAESGPTPSGSGVSGEVGPSGTRHD